MTSPIDKAALRSAYAPRGLAVAAAAALLAACAVGPDYKRPDAPPAQRYTAEPLPQATTASTGTAGAAQTYHNGGDIPAQWWTLFHSEPLNALVQQSLKANPDLAAAQAALRQAHENLLAQQGSFFPTVTGSAGGTRQKIAGAEYGQPGLNQTYNLYNASVNVSYTLDVWGLTRREVEAARAQADYEKFELEGSYLTLTSNVVTTAIQEASLRGQIAATQQIIDADRKQLETLKRQFQLGGVSQVNVLTQQTQLANELATLPPLQKQLQQNRDLLATLLGQTPDQQPAAQFELDQLTLPQDLPVSLPSKLVEQRPDVRAQEELLHQASANVGVATANMLPQLTLNGSFGDYNTVVGHLLDPPSNVWSLGGSIAQPIFEGGTLLHKKRAAVAAYEQAAAQYRSTVLTAFRNVADTLHALNSDADALLAQNQAEEAAAKTLELTRTQYKNGSVSYLDLLVAERDYQQARIAQLQAQAARYADTAALFQALGGGWWNRTADQASTGQQQTAAATP